MSLAYIDQQILIYFGFFVVIIGVFGNGLNIFIFLSARNYRTTPCTFYFLIASIFNIAYLAINMIARIFSTGFGIDLTRTSDSWCKIRQLCVFSLDLISLSCSCLATIDQFFVTSQSVRLRRLSSIKWTYRIVIIVIVISLAQEAPFIFTQSISPITGTCTNSNPAYAIYVSAHVIGLICVIPVTVMMVFGYLGYHNIQLTRVLAEQRADRQLIRTLLIQMALAVICFIPYGISIAYVLSTSKVSKDSNRLAIESFASTLITLLFYCYFAVRIFTSYICD
jgi:hypothetical protein